MTAIYLSIPLFLYLLWLWLHKKGDAPAPEEKVDMKQIENARRVMEKPVFEMSTGRVFTKRNESIPHEILERMNYYRAGRNTLLSFHSMYLFSRPSLPFNSKAHLKKFLDYLFRTDKAQKWTTLTTPNCLVLVHSKNTIYKMGDINSRRKMVKHLYRLLEERWEELQMRLSELHDKNGIPLLITEEEECKTLLEKYISHTRQTFREYQTLLFVAHLDIEERPYHIHEIIIPQQLIL